MKKRFYEIIKQVSVAIIPAFVFYYLYKLGFGIPCPIKKLFGISCPSCGITRMSVCFIHGKIRKAFHYNQVLPFILPILFIIFLRQKYRYILYDNNELSKLENTIIIILIIILILYGIIRNLPFYPWKI